MCFEVQPKRLLVASEVRPCRIVDRHVGLCTNEVRLRLVAVEHEHLGDFSVNSIRGVVANGQVFWIEELSDTEVSSGVGQDVNRFNGRCVVRSPLNVHLDGQLWGRFNHTRDGVEPVHVTRKDGRALSVEPEVVRQIERDVRRRFVVGVKDAVVVVIPIRGQIIVLHLVEINVDSGVVIVVVVNGVRSGGSIGGVGNAFAVTKVVVVPRVGGVSIEAGGPKQNLVFIVHAVLVVVLVEIVASSVVVVVEGCGNADQQLNGVGDAVAVPIVVGPVQDAVVVVIPRGLLLTPETTVDQFLINVEASVVVVVGVLAVRNAVVVVVDVVDAGRTKTLRHDALVPNRLVKSVVVCVSVVTVVVVVVAV